jgi:hypothetical protein
MPYILVRQEVEDYIKWKPVFDDSRTVNRMKASPTSFALKAFLASVSFFSSESFSRLG